jgi:nucleoside-diphosphate-sugar epimerase
MLTGATGFIGSHIAERLIKNKIVTHLFVRRRNSLIDSFEKMGAKIYVAQPDNLKILKKSLKTADVVIHCAGATKALRKKDYIGANVEFTTNILSLLNQQQKFIFISSQAAAGPSNPFIPIDEEAKPNPLTDYGKSKLLAEHHIRQWGQKNRNNYAILRPSVVYGPRERDLYQAFKLVKKGLHVFLGSGDIKLSLIHVTDLVEAIITAAEYPSTGNTYFVTDDGTYTWEEIGTSIKRAFNKKHLLNIKIPVSVCHPIVFLFDYCSLITGKPSIINRQKLIEMKQSAWLCSNSKIKEDLRWKPKISLEKGIKQTVDWYIGEGWI